MAYEIDVEEIYCECESPKDIVTGAIESLNAAQRLLGQSRLAGLLEEAVFGIRNDAKLIGVNL